ncbi:Uncharacterized membrane protein, DUF4010 family [Pricia antarctica]|uniref:Uncharacterized membrane protein, DUF4010 family n=1 Tax=Pricia antarctica TaxID=641691 RepID=A0A1G7CVN5_9FLAO|nr:DUF4010 domain-containing protein [Pricia antarctica]SDE43379.1 Uncharacterized membrane protein, DUF4010 family [Pricia antarctica]
MLKEILNKIPLDFLNFLLVTVFSLLIGLEQRSQHKNEQFESRFGTDRTFTLIGIFGYILYSIAPKNLAFFAGGGIAITALLVVYYNGKIKASQKFGITSLVTALITYCLAPLIYQQPSWLVILIVVTVLWVTELKESFLNFTRKFDEGEFVSLAKFLVIVGVILPLLPDKPISTIINISPYKFWMAIVAVSGISYFSYLLKKFVFPKSGILLTGILGGLYSSTAATIILARKSKEQGETQKVAPAILLATAMMYVRILLLAFFFNWSIGLKLVPSFVILIVVSIVVAIYFEWFSKSRNSDKEIIVSANNYTNPLEFRTALLFGALFIIFALVTGYVTKNFGENGIKVLSLVVGVTDIDPFIINLFQSKWDIGNSVITSAIIIATTSNNLLKMIYGIVLGNKSIRPALAIGFGILIIVGLLLAFVLPSY